MSKKSKGEGAANAAPDSGRRKRAFEQRLDEEHRFLAQEQKAYFREVADRLAKGQPLDELARMVAGAALLLLAEQMPDERKRPRGKQPEFSHWEAAWLYSAFTGPGGFTQQRAREYLADRYGVTEEAIRQAVEKQSKL